MSKEIIEPTEQVGTLKKAVGINGFDRLEVGSPVYMRNGTYILKMTNGKDNTEVTYLKESLTWNGELISPHFKDIVDHF